MSAACAGQPIEWFFGPPSGAKGGGRSKEMAMKRGKKVCAGCDVRNACYEQAKALPWGAWGIWGGVLWRDGVPEE